MENDPLNVLRRRAYELADTGEFRFWTRLRAALTQEGQDPFQLRRLNGDSYFKFRLYQRIKIAQGNPMPKGPKGEKRPADVIGAAVKVMRIATGEEPEDIDTPESRGKDPHASAMSKKGAAARAKKVSPERRAEIAKKAAAKRWKKKP